MKLIIHRGSREIGGSCIELQSKGDRIVIDLGIPLVNQNGTNFDLDSKSSLSGPELIDIKFLPKIQGFYHWDESCPKVKGLILSHSHMDHCGFISHVHLEVPIFAGEATHRLLELNACFTPFEEIKGEKAFYANRKAFSCGRFTIIPFIVDHSAFDAYALLIEADGKKLLYSGDFRSHGRKKKVYSSMIKTLSKTKIDALLLEGTMLGRNNERIETEDDLEQKIVELLKESNTPALVCVSAHNIDRLVTLYRASLRCSRLMVIDIYTANVLTVLKEFAKIPYPSPEYQFLRVFYPKALTRRIITEGHAEKVLQFSKYKITRQQIAQKQKEIIMMVRPSMLNDLENISLLPNVHFIYSMWKGLQEQGTMVRLMGFVKSRNMKIHELHSSGHADLKTLKEFVSTLQPSTVIPIHTLNPEGFNIISPTVRRIADGETYTV